MKTVAVIPTRYEPDRLWSLWGSLEVAALILDNGHQPPLDREDGPHTWVETARGLGIYAMWNRGRQWARAHGYDNVAIINDDIQIIEGTLSVMAAALRSDPRIGVVYPDHTTPLGTELPDDLRLTPTEGTRSDNGMLGYCFMLRGELDLPPFDEGFHWWFGDDAFEREVRRAGYTVNRIEGLAIEHESDSESNGWARRPELEGLVELDRARWEAMK